MQEQSRTNALIPEHRYNSGWPKLDGMTVAQRVYLVRLACGDGIRKPMPMREFAELLTGDGETVHPSRVSDIENEKSPPTLAEIERIAVVDPLKRGKSWLAWGDDDQEGGQGAKHSPTRPRAPIKETEVEYLPHKPTHPSRPTGKHVKRRPGRSAVA